MTWTWTLDLSAAWTGAGESRRYTGIYADGAMRHDPASPQFPNYYFDFTPGDLLADPASECQIEVTLVEPVDGAEVWLFSQISPDGEGYDGNWNTLGVIDNFVGNVGTASITVTAHAPYVLFECGPYPLAIEQIRYRLVPIEPPSLLRPGGSSQAEATPVAQLPFASLTDLTQMPEGEDYPLYAAWWRLDATADQTVYLTTEHTVGENYGDPNTETMIYVYDDGEPILYADDTVFQRAAGRLDLQAGHQYDIAVGLDYGSTPTYGRTLDFRVLLTAPGEWIQAPDIVVEAYGRGGAVAPGALTQTLNFDGNPSPPGNAAEYQAMIERLDAPTVPPVVWGDTASADHGASYVHMRYRQGQGMFFGPPFLRTEYSGYTSIYREGFSARHLTPFSPPAQPADAIGTEAESDRCTVVGAVLNNLVMLDYNHEVSTGTGVNGNWETVLWALQDEDLFNPEHVFSLDASTLAGRERQEILTHPKSGPTGTTPDNSVYPDIDLTPFLYGEPGDGLIALAGRTRILSTPLPTNPSAHLGTNNPNYLSYGAAIKGSDDPASGYTSLRVQYTLRPPRYRYLMVIPHEESPPTFHEGPRIYFLNSNWDNPEDPTNKLCYWDGTIHEVNPNIDYDLGAGPMSFLPNGRIAVGGPRWGKWINAVDYGDYWDDDGYEEFPPEAEDTIVYTLDADLLDPQPFFTDTIANTGGYYGGLGWRPRDVGDPAAWIDDGTIRVFHHGGEVIVVGYRRQPATPEDYGEGFIVHRFSPDGILIRRDFVHEGEGGVWPGQPDGSQTLVATTPQYASLDPVHGIIYMCDGWAVYRYNLATGERAHAPTVFPWQQSSGYGTDPRFGMTNEETLAAGRIVCQLPNGEWYGIDAYTLWRSRRLVGFDVDPSTGHIMALVDGYLPYHGEYAVNVPPLPVPGGQDGPTREYQILRIDPERLVWFHDFFNPWPYDSVDDNGYGYSEEYQRWVRPLSGPPQRQADIEVITLSLDRTITCVPGATPFGLGFGLTIKCFTVSATHAYFVSYVDDPPGLLAVFEVDLVTGVGTQLFVDDRVTKDPDYMPGGQWYDPNYPSYINLEIQQLLVTGNVSVEWCPLGWWDGTTIRPIGTFPYGMPPQGRGD